MESPSRKALYRDSIAWQKSMELAAMVYKMTQRFPTEERFGLTNQLRRASVSVPSNIAEGKGRTSIGELIQFVGIARGSTLEIQTQMEIAVMLGRQWKRDRRGATSSLGDTAHPQCFNDNNESKTFCKKKVNRDKPYLSTLYCLLSEAPCKLAINANP